MQDSSWAPSEQAKQRFSLIFKQHDGGTGYLNPVTAKQQMVQSGLPPTTLGNIWNLVDFDKSGKLDEKKFILAMWLCLQAKKGQALPASIPSTYFSQANSISSTPSPTRPLTAFSTAIDPRKSSNESSNSNPSRSAFCASSQRNENFLRGQAELEKRRQALQEQQKKETERLEQERKQREEKMRLEREAQEKKKEAEIAMIREKQRQKELEIENVRRNAAQQRETARNQLAQKRKLEWESQRRQQVQNEMLRLKDEISNLKARNQNVDIEVESMAEKQKISKNRLIDMENQRFTIETDVNKAKEMLARSQNELQQKQESIQKINVQAAQYDHESKNLVQLIEEMEQKIKSNPDILKKISEKEQSLASLKQEIFNIQTENNDLDNRVASLDKQITEEKIKCEKSKLNHQNLNHQQQDAVRKLQEMRITTATPQTTGSD